MIIKLIIGGILGLVVYWSGFFTAALMQSAGEKGEDNDV